MTVPVIQVGASGVRFVLEVRDQSGAIVDLSTAITLNVIFRAGPTGTPITLPGALLTDGSDGKFSVTTGEPSELDVAHECWQYQGEINVPGIYVGRTEVRTFPVKPNLE
jgi:hypothetical protein